MDDCNASSSTSKSFPSRSNSTRKLLSKLLRHKSRSSSVPPELSKLPPVQRKSLEEPTNEYLLSQHKRTRERSSRRNSGPPAPSREFSVRHGCFTNSNTSLSLAGSLFKNNTCLALSKECLLEDGSKSRVTSGARPKKEAGSENTVIKMSHSGISKEFLSSVSFSDKIKIPSSSSVSDLYHRKKSSIKAMRSKSDHNVRDNIFSNKSNSSKTSCSSSSASLNSNFKPSSPDLRSRLSRDRVAVHQGSPPKSCNRDKKVTDDPVENQDNLGNEGSLTQRDDNSLVIRSEPPELNISMDSLAKQALLAASVFHLIPTNKARERNYLHGRIAAMSLMGPLELEKVLPFREVTIFVGTWNMNGQAPPKELNDFLLPEVLEHVPDVVAIGTQESYPEKFEWEVSLQETLGPSHVLLHSASLGTLHLAVFVRRDLLWFCSIAEEGSVSTRTGKAFRTKGGVAVGFLLFGTSFLFVTSHLTAHTENFKDRVNDLRRISTSIDLPKLLPVRQKSRDITQNFDCTFWCGDLNFRLDQPREEIMEWIVSQQFPSEEPLVLPSDQLQKAMAEGIVFKSFGEAAIKFPPTYKFDPGTDHFDSSSKMRTPSYTDRILYKPASKDDRKPSSIECLHYYSAPSIRTSDHKPLWSVFRASIRPGKDTIPLAAGLFNREVYLEGIKRRAASIHRRQGYSTVCSIQ